MTARISIIVASQNDAGTCAAIQTLTNMILESGSRVVIADASLLQPASERFQRYKFLTTLSKLSKKSPINSLHTFSMNLKIPIICAEKRLLQQAKKESKKLFSEIPETIEQLEKWEKNFPRLGRSLASVLCTDIARSSQPKIPKYASEVKLQIRHFLANYTFMKMLIHKVLPSEVVIFNGRRPNTASLIDAAEEYNIPVKFFETNWDGLVFLESFSPHDRDLVQRQSIKNCGRITRNDLVKYVQDFEKSRAQELNRNQFIRNFEENLNLTTTHNGKIVMFTSSPDEFVGVGKSWEPEFWTSQEHAISEIAKILKLKNLEFVIRMHPNTLNKTWFEYLRQVNFYSSLNCEVIRPESSINSYDLIEASSGVIVWASTIGLESAIRNKPTWTLAPNLYDLESGVKIISSREEALMENFDYYKYEFDKLIPPIVGMQRGYCWVERQSEFFDILNLSLKHIRKIQRIENMIDYLLLPFTLIRKLRTSPEALNRWICRAVGPVRGQEYWSIIIANSSIHRINGVRLGMPGGA